MSDISPTLSNEIRSDDYYVIVGHNRGINQLQTKVIYLNYLEIRSTIVRRCPTIHVVRHRKLDFNTSLYIENVKI